MNQSDDSGTSRPIRQHRDTITETRPSARPEAIHYVLGFSLVLAAAAFVMVHHLVAR